ncbi:MAG: DNA replication/repair protein RecF [Propionibacteriaceae bacterium]|nr:DNA replication/repair protein RecF [Propionibacteriaceae bacterium]
MYLSYLRLTDFRSYEVADLALKPGVSVFLGPNGFGKTNLVEAVEFLATLGSHRVASDQPLIRAGRDAATVAGRVQAGIGDDRSLTVAVDIRAGAANRAQLNRAPVRPRDVIGAVRTVVFAPEDLAIVRGDPGGRRAFIDELITSRWPRLAGVRAEYDRALKQKTALLKAMSGRGSRQAGAGGEEALAVWGQTMAHLGAEIVAARLRTLTELAPLVAADYDAIAPVSSAASAVYHSSSIPAATVAEVTLIEQLLNDQMSARLGDETTRGVCLVGPHRDDIVFSLGDLPVKGYASHGEGWSYALALRLASLELLHDDGVEPILILDDVFAELDEHRRVRVVAAMESVEQTLITAAVRRDLPTNLTAEVFLVSRGAVRSAGELSDLSDGVEVDAASNGEIGPVSDETGVTGIDTQPTTREAVEGER